MNVESHDLLSYNAQYGVLICIQCEYAIQKSAVASHLLRHKIYRMERQDLLAAIAKLELHEPEDVPLPSPDAQPVGGLPVLDGYRCTVVGCGNLCASEKRMRRHWSDAHGDTEISGVGERERRVKIQTFFRGTKIRYFEVDAPTEGLMDLDFHRMTVDDDAFYSGLVGQAQTSPLLEAEVFTQEESDSTPRPLLSHDPPSPASVEINMETLAYFHYFTTETCLTLPTPIVEAAQSSIHYWQSEVVTLALPRRWLMSGLLSLSAFHFAALANNEAEEMIHLERAARLCSQFMIERKPGPKTSTGDPSEEAARIAARRISSILRLARCALRNKPVIDARTVPGLFPIPPLQLVLFVLRSLANTIIAPHPHTIDRAENTGNAAEALLREDLSGSILIRRLNALPVRIGDVFGTPEPHELDNVLASITTTAALIRACEACFSGPQVISMQIAWERTVKWTVELADDFSDMISQNHPAALIVVAHWTMLIRRAESCGSWFLRAVADVLMSEIRGKLKNERIEIGELVEGLSG